MHATLSVLLAAVLFASVPFSDAALRPVAWNSPVSVAAYDPYRWYLLANRTVVKAAPNGANVPASTVATAVYNASYLDLGWDYFHVTPMDAWRSTSNNANFQLGCTNAGYLEGYLMRERIYQTFGAQGNNYTLGTGAQKFVDDQIEFINSSSTAHMNLDPYWQSVKCVISQLEGIVAGYNARAALDGRPATELITFGALFRMNYLVEASDVVIATNSSMTAAPPRSSSHHSHSMKVQEAEEEELDAETLHEKKIRRIRHGEHCSALVKSIGSDIFFSHVTWSGFTDMVRAFKVYNFSTTVSLSGYAGIVHSVDDFYQTSKGLAVMETTNDYYNDTLAKLYVVPKTVPEFIRVMVANYLTSTGSDWVLTYQALNSGTYNNQWMVLDTKLFTPNMPLVDNLFWVAEQMPGNVTSADMTWKLRQDSYWASYNVPYFRNIYVDSGFEVMKKKDGDFWGYHTYARAQIFARNQSMITDLESFRAVMRYNGWQYDPLSKIKNCTRCSPANSPYLAIASRGDMVSKTAVLPEGSYADYFDRGAFGAIDAKVTSATMMTASPGGMPSAVIINGPTAAEQPPFSFTGDFAAKRPPGAPETFDFDWIQVNQIPVTANPSGAAPSTPSPASPPATPSPVGPNPAPVPPAQSIPGSNLPQYHSVLVNLSTTVRWSVLRSNIRAILCSPDTCPGYLTDYDFYIVGSRDDYYLESNVYYVSVNTSSLMFELAALPWRLLQSLQAKSAEVTANIPPVVSRGRNQLEIRTSGCSGYRNFRRLQRDLLNVVGVWSDALRNEIGLTNASITESHSLSSGVLTYSYNATYILSLPLELQVELRGIDWGMMNGLGLKTCIIFSQYASFVEYDPATLVPAVVDATSLNRVKFVYAYLSTAIGAGVYYQFTDLQSNIVSSVNSIVTKGQTVKVSAGDITLISASTRGFTNGTVNQEYLVSFSTQADVDQLTWLVDKGHLTSPSAATLRFYAPEASPATTAPPTPTPADNESMTMIIVAGVIVLVVVLVGAVVVIRSRSGGSHRTRRNYATDDGELQSAFSMTMK